MNYQCPNCKAINDFPDSEREIKFACRQRDNLIRSVPRKDKSDDIMLGVIGGGALVGSFTGGPVGVFIGAAIGAVIGWRLF